jgi:hypothetical protein
MIIKINDSDLNDEWNTYYYLKRAKKEYLDKHHAKMKLKGGIVHSVYFVPENKNSINKTKYQLSPEFNPLIISYDLNYLYINKNITSISSNTFKHPEIKILEIENPDIIIEDSAFYSSSIDSKKIITHGYGNFSVSWLAQPHIENLIIPINFIKNKKKITYKKLVDTKISTNVDSIYIM